MLTYCKYTRKTIKFREKEANRKKLGHTKINKYKKIEKTRNLTGTQRQINANGIGYIELKKEKQIS